MVYNNWLYFVVCDWHRYLLTMYFYLFKEFLRNLEEKEKMGSNVISVESEEGNSNDTPINDKDEHNIIEKPDEKAENNEVVAILEEKHTEDKNIFEQLGNMEVSINNESKETEPEPENHMDSQEIATDTKEDTPVLENTSPIPEVQDDVPDFEEKCESSVGVVQIISETVSEAASIPGSSKSKTSEKKSITNRGNSPEIMKLGKILKKKMRKKSKKKNKHRGQIFPEPIKSNCRPQKGRPPKAKSLMELLDLCDKSQTSEIIETVVPPINGIANPENNDSHSSDESIRSSKKTHSKTSNDHNSFFPTNMPQTVQEIFMVEKILKMKLINGVRKFFLKWEGFPDSENTWEPEENLECPELIKVCSTMDCGNVNNCRFRSF